MGFLTARRTITRLAPSLFPQPPSVRERPEMILLDGTPAGASKPTVRIFMGTEAGQHRAERVFVWSVEAVRDRTRRYEIYLMKDLIGYDRRTWLTGFTNYRFLIPHLAGRTGRAIYNDVDQIYLADPAELFDTDLEGRGFLAITDRDTSVMLIDCERMARIWTPEMVSTMRRKAIEGAARAVNAWGPLDRMWNSRDEEYVAGKSKLLHYTTIHTQPWQPFPAQYVYQHNKVGHVWHELERGADAAGFQVYTLARPTSLYTQDIARIRQAAASAPGDRARAHWTGDLIADASSLLDRCDAKTLLEFGKAGLSASATLGAEGRTAAMITHDPIASDGALGERRFDAVLSMGFLELLSDEDVPWVLEELFRHATRLVYVGVGVDARMRELANAAGIVRHRRDSAWWLAQMEIAAGRHPNVHWRLWVENDGSGNARVVHDGGRRPHRDAPPTTWVIGDHKAGHTTQSIGLAQALGWNYEVRDIGWNPLQLLTDRILGPLAIDFAGTRRKKLRPPWPDLVIGTGWRTPPVLRWIAQQSGHMTRTVQMGRKGAGVASHFDLVVSCSHFRFFPHPHRVEIVAPVTQVTPARLEAAAAQFPDLFRDAPKPWIVLLVGGSSPQYRLDPDTARTMGTRLGALARRSGGTVFAVTSPRTGEQVAAELQHALAGAGRVHQWRPHVKENPYLAYLAGADAIVVTGESESMLAEAVATRKPVYVYDVPKRPLGPVQLATDWITKRAYRKNRKLKGTIRPQQGLEYICARLIEHGLVLPPRDMSVLHRQLFDCGAARPFDDTLELTAPVVLDETATVVERIKSLLGYRESESESEAVHPGSMANAERAGAGAPPR